MLTKEENQRFTQVGPGTPMGNLMRRYWHPVGTLADLGQDPVRPVRLLGEDLVLFRSEAGSLGLIANRCLHRGLDMAYGIPQPNGLRCAYHGWTYDTAGHVVDMPFEPACLPLKTIAYPVQELCGIVWAYLGPRAAPLLPRWDVLVRDDLNKEVRITELPCSWLQCMDNSLDPVHYEHLHATYGNYILRKLGKDEVFNPTRHLKIDFDLWEYGIYKRRLLEGQTEDCGDWTVGHPILFPNILAQGGPTRMSFQIRTPIDDTHTLHICVDGWPPKPGEELRDQVAINRVPIEYDELGRVLAPHVVAQDEMAWIGQGPITDRSLEHLASSDRGILLYRKLLLENMEKVERGEDPIAVIRNSDLNEPYIPIKRGSSYTAFVANGEYSSGIEASLAALRR